MALRYYQRYMRYYTSIPISTCQQLILSIHSACRTSKDTPKSLVWVLCLLAWIRTNRSQQWQPQPYTSNTVMGPTLLLPPSSTENIWIKKRWWLVLGNDDSYKVCWMVRSQGKSHGNLSLSTAPDPYTQARAFQGNWTFESCHIPCWNYLPWTLLCPSLRGKKDSH